MIDSLIVVKPMPPHTMRWWINRLDLIDLVPGYQREGNLWSGSDKAYLIDSILNGFDIPKIYLADFTQGSPELNRKLLPYAVIDGKQRLEAIRDFVDGRLVLNSDFILLSDTSIRLGGLSYKDLLSSYPRVADRFDEFELPMMSVLTSQLGLVDELFVRLNRSKPLTGAELRNAANAPLAVMIRKLAEHEFFRMYVKFAKSRGQDKNLAAKLLMFEYLGKPASTKKRDLDAFAHDEKANHDRARNSLAAASQLLDTMTEIFLPKDVLLSSAGTIPVYYWLIRETPVSLHRFVRDFLGKFEEARKINRGEMQSRPESRTLDQDLAFYDFLNRNTNDSLSHERRYEILKKKLLFFAEKL